ncbi:general secretion pathway protein GspB [Ideonella alba]|uniref:General secretion pathway protein GspB n=1 Tax=Ideonella alba TaxID=2824118 RepID=A0A941BAS3_9BURK|nr:general secretion pathway protein GspB [Ideonella alba]MBQ0930105.1 general secretion pathway protein GspB [Ideonella alba]
MSIILDALRRADAERERSRGAVPGLHDQVDLPTPVSAAVDEPAAAGERRPPWVLIAVLSVLLLTAVAWWLRTSQRPPAPAPGAATEPPPVTLAQGATAPVPSTAPVAPTVAVTPPPAAPTTAPAPAPTTAPVPALPSPVLSAAPAAKPPEPRAGAGLKMSEESAPPPPSRPVLRYQDLPGATRAELPTLKLGGAMVSDSPGGSVLVINDQLMREGDSVVPGLLLERIGPRSARLRWKDQRFEMPY